MSILDKIAENVDYSQIFSKNVDLGQKFANISMLVKIVEKFRFWSILSENLDLGQHFRKISILLNIFGKIFPRSWFW